MSVEEKSELLHTQLLASCNIIPGINIVNCSLKELPLHCPSCASDTTAQKVFLSSSQRRKLSKAPGLPPADIFAQLTVEQIVMSRKPTLIDRLISKNKTALIMESRARKRGGKPIKEEISMNGKRKANTTEEHLEKKRLRSSKADMKKDVQKTVLPPTGRKRKSESDPPPGTNRYATRISMNKVRIPFSLRSGRKMADILKSKRKRGMKQHLQQNITEKKINQVDSDQLGNKIKSEEIKPKKKRRKRCSMWVRKNKRPSKKVEDLPVLNKVESEEDDKTEVEEEVEPLMPTLEKEIDHKDIILKDEDIKNESLDISLQSKSLVVNEIAETNNCALTTKVPTVDSYEVFTENNIEIKNEETNFITQDTKLDDGNEDVTVQLCEGLSDVPRNERNITTQEIIGTKPQLPINSEIELDRPENSNSDLGQPLSISSSTAEKIENNIRNLQTNGTIEAENENIKTEYQTAFDKDIEENDRKLNNKGDSGSMITEEEQIVLYKGLKKCVDPVSENELNATDVQKSCKLNCDIISNPDVKKDQEENYQIHLNGNVEPEESFRQKLKEPDTLIQLKEGNNAGELNNRPNEGENKISCSEDEEEEIHPREADSTSDVPPAAVGSSASEQFSASYNVELTKSFVEVPVLPDSTKEVKASSPEIKLEKEQTHDRDILKLETSSQSKDLPIINNTESKSSKVNVKDISENRGSLKEEGCISIERKQMKESVLQALGLKSLSAASDHKLHNDEEKQKNNNQQQQRNNSGYTGTLKAVIKLNRSGDKKRSMVYKRNEDALSTSDKLEYRICSDFPSTESVPITHLADMGYNKKGFHHKNSESVTNSVYVNTNVGNSNNEETDVNGEESKGNKESSLIIPEKSSSFSIHPGRLCSDVCSYCFGKFGSLDTPCHVAQIKGEERQKKILQNEPHLTPESCLCDACYRYVDRKVNYHPKAGNQQGTNTNNNSNSNAAPKSHHQPQPQATCCVVGCLQQATHTIKRKGILKLKKNLTNKLDIDMDKHTGLYFPFCSQHHYWVEYLTVCGICRKRLNRNSLFSLGSEADKLNLMLAEDGIPARLSDNLFLCKLCRYYSNLRLKYSDASAIPSQNKSFYKSYRRKILMSLDIAVSNSEDECDNSEDSSTPEKKHIAGASSSARKVCLSSTNGGTGGNIPADNPAGGSSSNNESTSEETVSLSDLATLLGDQPEPQQTRIQVKFGNVNIGTLSNLNIGQQGAGSASSPATTDRESSEGSLSCNLDFKGPSPDGNLERCVTTIQFDKKAKQLWTELQKPHGTQSLFLRHLIMMEKIWRAGHLVLSANADEKAIKYVLNAKNKIRACENSSVNAAGSNIGPTNAARPTKTKETCQTAVHPVRLQQQLQQPPLKVPPKPPPLQPQLLQPSHTKPQVVKQSVPQQIVPPTQERFPLLPNNGEIEVTPVRTTAQTQVVTVVPSPVITVTSSLQQQQYMRPTNLQNFRPNVPQTNSSSQQTTVLQQQLMSKKLTPLDRAKSLVRMAIPQHSRPPPPRYYIPPQNLPAGHQHYFVGGGNSNRAPPPPLMKLQSYYQHQQQLNQQSAVQQQPYQQSYIQQQLQQQPQPRTILPKLPKSLTVVSRMNNKPTAITLRNSGITIEKQSSVPSMRSSHPLPVEKPIISVFREPATSPQQH